MLEHHCGPFIVILSVLCSMRSINAQQNLYLLRDYTLTTSTPTQSSFATAIPINQTSANPLFIAFSLNSMTGQYDVSSLSSIGTGTISLLIDAEPGITVQAGLRIEYNQTSSRREVFRPLTVDDNYGQYESYVETWGLTSVSGEWRSTTLPFRVTLEVWVVQGSRPAVILTPNSYITVPYRQVFVNGIPVIDGSRKQMLKKMNLGDPISIADPPFARSIRNKFYLNSDARVDLLNRVPSAILLNSSVPLDLSSARAPTPHPLPTNVWWENAVLQTTTTATGNSPVYVLPYLVTTDSCGAYFNKGIVDVLDSAVFTTFRKKFYLSFALDSELATKSFCTSYVTAWDHVSYTMRMVNRSMSSNQYIEFPFVRGSPYFSAYYSRVPMTLVLDSQVSSLNDRIVFSGEGPLEIVTNRLYIGTPDLQKWVVYFSTTVTVIFQNGPGNEAWSFFKTSGPILGWVRVAFVSADDEATTIFNQEGNLAVLDSYSTCVVKGGTLSYNTSDPAFDLLMLLNHTEPDLTVPWTYSFVWETATPCNPIMLAMPHHLKPLQQSGHSLYSQFSYITVSGQMVAVIAAKWTLQMTVPAVQMTDFFSMEPCQVTNLLEAYEMDQFFGTKITEKNPYQAFKMIYRLARLVQVGEYLQQTSTTYNMRKVLAANLEGWLNASFANYFTYDAIWGGLVTPTSVSDSRNDFGYGWYNDHHFAGGYFMYSVAVLISDDRFRSFHEKYKDAIQCVVRDIANPSTADPYFPVARHFDWFRGHSWAAGIQAVPDGRNQESSSEAAFAYYAVAMYGKAANISSLSTFGRILASMESLSSQTYWQIKTNTTVYPATFRAGAVVGINHEMRVTRQTYFTDKTYGAHFIQMIPFSPYSRYHVDNEWIDKPTSDITIIEDLLGSQTVLDNIWRAYYALALGMVDQVEAWKALQLMSTGWFDVAESRSSGFLFVGSMSPYGMSTACITANPLPVRRGSRLLFNGSANFFFRVVSYLPTPIGKDPKSDKVYRTKYIDIHKRDLQLIYEAGFNTVQVISNNDPDVSDFIDLCASFNLYVILTFSFSVDAGIDAGSIEDSWRKFLILFSSSKNIVMWAMGTPEILDTMPDSTYKEYFGLMKRLINVRDKEDRLGGRPMITPISDAKFGAVASQFDSSVEVWQVTIYHSTDPTANLLTTSKQALTVNPLIISVTCDAYSVFAGKEDELSQAKYIVNHVDKINVWWHAGMCSGVQVIEWSDQWWKSRQASYDSDCPEFNPSKHSICGRRNDNIPDSYLSEEYLGMVAQSQGWLLHCITPRMVYASLATFWAPFRSGALVTSIAAGETICVFEPLIFPTIALIVVTTLVATGLVIVYNLYYYRRAGQLRKELITAEDLEKSDRQTVQHMSTSWAHPNYFYIEGLVYAKIKRILIMDPFQLVPESVSEGSHRSFLARCNLDRIIWVQADHLKSLLVDEMLCLKKIDHRSVLYDFEKNEVAYYDALFKMALNTLHFRFFNHYNGWQDAQLRLAKNLRKKVGSEAMKDFTKQYEELEGKKITVTDIRSHLFDYVDMAKSKTKLADLLVLLTVWHQGEHMTRFSGAWLSWLFHYCKTKNPGHLVFPPEGVANDMRHFCRRDVTFDDIEESCMSTLYFHVTPPKPDTFLYPKDDLVQCLSCKKMDKVTQVHVTLGTSANYVKERHPCKACKENNATWGVVKQDIKKIPVYNNFPFTKTFREPRKGGVFWLMIHNYFFIFHTTIMSFALWTMLCNELPAESVTMLDALSIDDPVAFDWITSTLAKIDIWLCIIEEVLDIYFTFGLFDFQVSSDETRPLTWIRVVNSASEHLSFRWVNYASFVSYWPLLGESTFTSASAPTFYVVVYLACRAIFVIVHNVALFLHFPKRNGHPRYHHREVTSLLHKIMWSAPAALFWLCNYTSVMMFQLWLQFQMRRMDFEMCVCTRSVELNNMNVRGGLFTSLQTILQGSVMCFEDKPRCMFAVLLLWVIIFSVQLILLQVTFYVWSMLAGILSGVIQNWKTTDSNSLEGKKIQAASILRHINTKMLGFAHAQDTSVAIKVWNAVIEDIYRDNLLSLWEYSCLRIETTTTYLVIKVENSFAKDRIASFLRYIEDYSRSNLEPHVDLHSVLLYDSISVVIPVYGEPVLAENGINQRKMWNKQHLSQLHFLAENYADEWRNFCEYMISHKGLFRPPIISEDQYVYIVQWKHECTKYFKLADETYEGRAQCPVCNENVKRPPYIYLTRFLSRSRVPEDLKSCLRTNSCESCNQEMEDKDFLFMCSRCGYSMCEECNEESTTKLLVEDLKKLDRPVEKVRRLMTQNVLLLQSVAEAILTKYHIMPSIFSKREHQEINWWSTLRLQTVARTVRGAEKKREAFAFLFKQEVDYTQSHDMYPRHVIQSIAAQKVQICVCCQILPDLKWWKANRLAIQLMCTKFPNIELVFDVDFTKRSNDPEVVNMVYDFLMERATQMVSLPKNSNEKPTTYLQYATCIMKYSPRKNKTDGELNLAVTECVFRDHELRAKKDVKLGLNSFMQGKPVNQGHSLPFVKNQIVQALDSNQDGYFEEALKLRSILKIFYLDDVNPIAQLRRNVEEKSQYKKQLLQYTRNPTVTNERMWSHYKIVGFREYIVTTRSGTLGRYTSYAEYVFVSIFQRVLSYPLGVRMHYGHPDFFDASWVLCQGGMSKPNPLVNLNEDIFAGYHIKNNGERIIHVEFMLEGKGRETNFDGGNGFEAKLAMGAAMQFRTRDIFELSRRCNIVERHSLLFGTIGYYIFSTITVALITFHMLTHILLHLAGVSSYDLGVRGSPFATEWVMQLGMVQAVPLCAQLVIDYGIRGLWTYIRDVAGVTFYFTFCLMTKHYWFLKSLLNGNADYIATGRSDPLVRLSYKHFFRFYGYTHFMHALFMLSLVVVYANVSELPLAAVLFRSMYTLTTATIWICSPVIFNPSQTVEGVWDDFSRFFNWIFGDNVDHLDPRTIAQETNKLKREQKKWLIQLFDKLSRANVQDKKEDEDDFDDEEEQTRKRLQKRKSSVATGENDLELALPPPDESDDEEPIDELGSPRVSKPRLHLKVKSEPTSPQSQSPSPRSRINFKGASRAAKSLNATGTHNADKLELSVTTINDMAKISHAEKALVRRYSGAAMTDTKQVIIKKTTKMTAKQEEELKQVFKEIDVNASNTLDKGEVCLALVRLGLAPVNSEITELMNHISKSGEVNEQQFILLVDHFQANRKSLRPFTMTEAWQSFAVMKNKLATSTRPTQDGQELSQIDKLRYLEYVPISRREWRLENVHFVDSVHPSLRKSRKAMNLRHHWKVNVIEDYYGKAPGPQVISALLSFSAWTLVYFALWQEIFAEVFAVVVIFFWDYVVGLMQIPIFTFVSRCVVILYVLFRSIIVLVEENTYVLIVLIVYFFLSTCVQLFLSIWNAIGIYIVTTKPGPTEKRRDEAFAYMLSDKRDYLVFGLDQLITMRRGATVIVALLQFGTSLVIILLGLLLTIWQEVFKFYEKYFQGSRITAETVDPSQNNNWVHQYKQEKNEVERTRQTRRHSAGGTVASEVTASPTYPQQHIAFPHSPVGGASHHMIVPTPHQQYHRRHLPVVHQKFLQSPQVSGSMFDASGEELVFYALEGQPSVVGCVMCSWFDEFKELIETMQYAIRYPGELQNIQLTFKGDVLNENNFIVPTSPEDPIIISLVGAAASDMPKLLASNAAAFPSVAQKPSRRRVLPTPASEVVNPLTLPKVPATQHPQQQQQPTRGKGRRLSLEDHMNRRSAVAAMLREAQKASVALYEPSAIERDQMEAWESRYGGGSVNGSGRDITGRKTKIDSHTLKPTEPTTGNAKPEEEDEAPRVTVNDEEDEDNDFSRNEQLIHQRTLNLMQNIATSRMRRRAQEGGVSPRPVTSPTRPPAPGGAPPRRNSLDRGGGGNLLFEFVQRRWAGQEKDKLPPATPKRQ